MSHWYVCRLDGSVVDIVAGMNAQDAIMAHCHYWSEPATPAQWGQYRAVKYIPQVNN